MSGGSREVFSWIYPSDPNNLLVQQTEKNLVGLSFTTQVQTDTPFRKNSLSRRVEQQLDAYFSGKTKTFDLPISLEGTSFQKQVWTALRRIPYGQTATYAQIAGMIGKPTACRAVGSAIARNRLAIIIPCHRIIRSDGEMGGYAWGASIKSRLLELEKINDPYGS